MTIDTESDSKELAEMAMPVKRTAYSGRTTWTMQYSSNWSMFPSTKSLGSQSWPPPRSLPCS